MEGNPLQPHTTIIIINSQEEAQASANRVICRPCLLFHLILMFPTILTICQRISEIIKFIQPSDVKEIQNDN